MSIIITGLFGIFFGISAQTNYTSSIINPSFETGNSNGWAWNGATGYAWLGPNTDGDKTKDGSYINGIWNSSIGDVECSQSISGLPKGIYKVTALLAVSTNRLTNQRLFVTSDGTTKSILYGSATHASYSSANLTILESKESYVFGGFTESSVENGPFHELSVIKQVTGGSLTLGIRVNGKATNQGFIFPSNSRGDAGFFKFDRFTLTEVSNLATLDSVTLSSGILDIRFNPATTTYTASIPEGVTTVIPTVIPSIEGVTVTGTGSVDLSSGTGTSTIVVTALDGITQKTYTILYKTADLTPGAAQEKLYRDEFPLSDVILLDGPFKYARDLNIQTLLKYDVNRLLAPYRKQAGLYEKATSYTNWEGLDGHIGGHYLTALAINFAATGDINCKQRMDYMIAELKACQDANALNNSSWGVGYAGGVPASALIWLPFKSGDFTNFYAAWVPWYNLHKTFAGLRDAWLYGGSTDAKSVFLSFCDWAINITSGLSDTQMETMLNVEHGGMNEILADAYQITGSSKYLMAAKRFSHKVLANSMAASIDNLDNMHANTQVPKVVGFERIAEVSNDPFYSKAGQFFWQTVTANRSLASGANSRKEYFPATSAYSDFLEVAEGPESCNSNNMLKLTEDLFRVNPQAKYADYFERVLFNHILSTQHPEHGGYVYFTPARPRHYRVYSAPNQAMWCCVGTGMENHGKYGEFIYTHRGDSLYLNLFIASELNWKEKGVKVCQETTFPNTDFSTLRVTTDKPTDFTLMIRSPKWVTAGSLKIVVNSDTVQLSSVPQTYIAIRRVWNNGDSVRVVLPMQLSTEALPNVPSYVAVMCGPILLGAKTETEDLSDLVADVSRWGHIAGGTMLSLNQAPVLLGSRDSIPMKMKPVLGKPLTFRATTLFGNQIDTSLILEPFYKIHDSRYMMYWMSLTNSQYKTVLDSIAAAQKSALELEQRTVDKVAPGEQQPEVDHKLSSSNSFTGNFMNEFWRDARNGGYMSYSMLTKDKTDLSVMARYWGNETGSRAFYIKVDETVIATEDLVGKWNKNEFVNVEYPIPNILTTGKEMITVKLEAINTGNVAGGLFNLRLLQPASEVEVKKVNDVQSIGVSVINNHVLIRNLKSNSCVFIYDEKGFLLHQVSTESNHLDIPVQIKGVIIIRIMSAGKVQLYKVLV